MNHDATPLDAGAEAIQPLGIEVHSIDYVPSSERHGKVSDLGAIWFVSNINLTAMATGIVALAMGAGLTWTIIATVIGSLFGTFFMAFHSAQGPQLGLPQLVQSRPQFGYRGAAVTVWVFALVNYVAYNTSDALLSGDAMHELTGVNVNLGYFLAATVAALIAMYGYNWIHRINRWLTWPLIVIMVLLTIGALKSSGLPTDAFTLGDFKLAPFMTVFVIMAGFQLGWAPYVSDYSRYLPANVGVRATFWWTYLPSALSGVWVFVLGAVAQAAAPEGSTPVAAFAAAGDAMFGGFGKIAVTGLLIGLLSVMAINQYGGMMSMISIKDSIRPVQPSRQVRIYGILTMFFLVWGIAQFVGIDRFNTFYGNVLIFLAYLFTPWTAINLVDYFFVRRGLYSVREIFNPNGIYGRWGWRGQTAYIVSIVVMMPFMVTTPFTGFIAKAWSSVDYSIFIGLPLAAGIYLLLSRSLDLKSERELVEAEGLVFGTH
jgi:NCS1 family nucleobase:cation symporter-1